MSIVETINTLLTLGKNAELKRKGIELDRVHKTYLAAAEERQKAEDRLRPELMRLGRIKKAGIRTLKRARWVVRHEGMFDSQERITRTGLPHAASDLEKIDTTIRTHETAVAACGGAGAGALAASGAWALVSAFGTASTGTAISGLGGAAATNAALAWFGGGTLAAGGGGMAAGSLVLGGFVLVPAVIFGAMATWNLNSRLNEQIKKIDDLLGTLAADTAKINATAKGFLEGIPRSQQIADRVESACEHFRDCYRDLFRWPILSRLWRVLKRMFTGFLFDPDEIQMVIGLEQAAIHLALAIDQKVFDADGNVAKESPNVEISAPVHVSSTTRNSPHLK